MPATENDSCILAFIGLVENTVSLLSHKKFYIIAEYFDVIIHTDILRET